MCYIICMTNIEISDRRLALAGGGGSSSGGGGGGGGGGSSSSSSSSSGGGGSSTPTYYLSNAQLFIVAYGLCQDNQNALDNKDLAEYRDYQSKSDSNYMRLGQYMKKLSGEEYTYTGASTLPANVSNGIYANVLDVIEDNIHQNPEQADVAITKLKENYRIAKEATAWKNDRKDYQNLTCKDINYIRFEDFKTYYAPNPGFPGGWIGTGIFLIPLLVAVLMFVLSARRSSKTRAMEREAAEKAKLQPEIEQKVKDIFMRYQNDWSNGNVAAMQSYMTPKYFQRASLMMRALADQNRRNEVSDITIHTMSQDQDYEGILGVKFHATAKDKLLDTITGATIYDREPTFTETWYFQKNTDGSLLLDDIGQATAELRMKNQSMFDFATTNNMEYFLDWGTLTLPARGQIFNGKNFGVADINNYVVGLWGNNLVQMYTYAPSVNVQANGQPISYLVGQIAVPKNYGGILVMPNKLIDRKPKGYEKYDLEWGDFNNKFDVFATDMDKVTSFELLNPAFMEFLHDNVEVKFTLEVVDNVIYFYAKTSTDANKYGQLLEVLSRAHKELKQ